ncbi:MAG: SLC13 family permease [Desulfurococcaceae archaeon]
MLRLAPKATAVLEAVIVVALISAALTLLIRVPRTGYGEYVVEFWRNETGQSIADFNSPEVVARQALSLAVFLLVVAFSVISMELRYAAAFFGVAALLVTGTVAPQDLLNGVDWGLIFFLVGSMALAFILRSFRTFEWLAVEVLRLSRGNPRVLLLLISALAWFLSMVVGEVTSIVYVTMLILDVRKLTRQDARPLIISSVLATNTGSLALPVGNPIGVYLAFAAGMRVTDFVVRALPLSLLALALLDAVLLVTLRGYLSALGPSLSPERLAKYVEAFRANLDRRTVARIRLGIAVLAAFLATVLANDPLSSLLSSVAGAPVEPSRLLAFVPYIYLVVVAPFYGPQEMGRAMEAGVEWPSLMFFVALFMLGYSLLHTGVASRLAYGVIEVSGGSSVNVDELLSLLLASSSTLSSVLDNLSVIVALTPVSRAIVPLVGGSSAFWALLYGGVLGGNFTPIGSTANIVAVGMAEREKIEVGWGDWLRVAFVPTLLQNLLAAAWLLLVAR